MATQAMNILLRKFKMIFSVAAMLCMIVKSEAQFYTGMHQPFGKNRIQYEQFDWQKFEFNKYTVFFYGKGRQLAEFTAFQANDIINEMERFFDYPLRSQKVQFIVYQKLEHFQQSNVGIPESGDANVGGVTHIAGNKVFLYYNGDLNAFKKQIRSGIAEVLLSQMLFGDNWREMIKNTTLLSFPEWYFEGLISYAAEPWSSIADDRLRDMILRQDYEKFNRLKGRDAEIAGHALWYYVAQTYGSNVIPNILYMSRVSRTVESGFLFVLGISLNSLLNDSKQYYQFRYETDAEGAQPFGEFAKIKTSKRKDYHRPMLNLPSDLLAYSSNELGRSIVYIHDLESLKTKKYLRSGYRLERIDDQCYPVLAWHPITGQLAVVTEKRGRLYLYLIDPKHRFQKIKIELLRLEKVLEMQFSNDGKNIIMSAINLGQSDIYLYSLAANNAKQITNDIFDDRYPTFWSDDKIIFSSNRNSDSVNFAKRILLNQPTNNFDLYSLRLKDDEQAFRLTNTPLANETHPGYYAPNQFMFISDESGISNRYLGYLDSAIVNIDTAVHYRYFTQSEHLSAYARGVREFNYSARNQILVEKIYFDGKERFLIKNHDEIKSNLKPIKSIYRELLELPSVVTQTEVETNEDTSGIKFIKKKVFDENPSIETDEGFVDIYDYKFDLETSKPEANKTKPTIPDYKIIIDSLKKQVLIPFRIPEQRNYNLAFAASDFTTQFDFNFATQFYQLYNGGPYINSGLGPCFKLGMLDVFEDYKLDAGFKYSFNSNGSEYFASLSNRAKRLDKQYIIQRQTMKFDMPNFSSAKNEMYQARAVYRYAIDPVNTVQFSGIGRYDRQIILASNTQELILSDKTAFWLGAKAEYIFDNTINRSLNILYGARAKVWAEHYRELKDLSLNTTVLGFDARHYQRIHRDLIWANRLAGSSSLGTRKLLYYLGSVDNWVILSGSDPNPRFDNTTNIANDGTYYYQTVATNMRGFKQNARNGNNFVVFNSELRWPIVRFITDNPLKSEFLANLQTIGFIDVGTSWNGPNPYSDQNAFNTIRVSNGSSTVIYKNQNDPILESIGWGLRTKLWGYFIRYDRAYGIENGKFIKPMNHLSIGLDF